MCTFKLIVPGTQELAKVASVIHVLLLVHIMFVMYTYIDTIIKEVVYQDIEPCMCCIQCICDKHQ